MTSLTIPTSKQKTDPRPLLTADLLLCTNGLLFFGSSLLEHMGYSSSFLRPVNDLTNAVGILGESITSTKRAKEGSSVALGVALSALRFSLLNQMNSYPVLKPVVLALNAYGTYAVVRRSLEELNKYSKAKTDWLVARNAFVHSVNATYSIYRTSSLFKDLSAAFFEDFKTGGNSPSPSPSPVPPAEKEEIISGVNHLSTNLNGLPEHTLACRTLYYNPSCISLHEEESDCAPTCQKLTEKELAKQYKLLTSKINPIGRDANAKKALSSIQKAEQFFQNVFLTKKQEELKVLGEEANSITIQKKQNDTNIAFARRILPNAAGLLDTMKDADASNSVGFSLDRAKISLIDAFCANFISRMDLTKYKGIVTSHEDSIKEAKQLIETACNEIQTIIANYDKSKNVITFRAKNPEPGKLGCVTYKKFCSLMNEDLPSIEQLVEQLAFSGQKLKQIEPTLASRFWGIFGYEPNEELLQIAENGYQVLSENLVDITSKISDLESRLQNLASSLNKLGTAPIHSQVSPSNNPYSPNQANKASSMLLTEVDTLKNRYHALISDLNLQLEKFKTLQTNILDLLKKFEPFKLQADQIKKNLKAAQALKVEQETERKAQEILDLRSDYTNDIDFYSELSPDLKALFDNIKNGQACSNEQIKAVSEFFRRINLQIHPDKIKSTLSNTVKEASQTINNAWTQIKDTYNSHNKVVDIFNLPTSSTPDALSKKLYASLHSLLSQPIPNVSKKILDEKKQSESALTSAQGRFASKAVKKKAQEGLDSLDDNISIIDSMILDIKGRLENLKSSRADLIDTGPLMTQLSSAKWTPQHFKTQATWTIKKVHTHLEQTISNTESALQTRLNYLTDLKNEMTTLSNKIRNLQP